MKPLDSQNEAGSYSQNTREHWSVGQRHSIPSELRLISLSVGIELIESLPHGFLIETLLAFILDKPSLNEVVLCIMYCLTTLVRLVKR